MPSIAFSLICAWGVLWAGAAMGYYWLEPAVTGNTEKIAALTAKVDNVEDGINALNVSFDAERAERIRDRIFELGIRKCEASGVEARQLLQKEVDRQRDKYEALTSRGAPMPPECG